MAGLGIVIDRATGGGIILPDVIASDGFSGTGQLGGRIVDNAAGGTNALQWTSTFSTDFAISGGQLVNGTGTTSAVAGVPMAGIGPNYYVSAVVKEFPTAALIGLVGRRTTIVSGTDVGVMCSPTGLLSTRGGLAIGSPVTISLGTRIGMRCIDGVADILVNDIMIASGATALSAAGFAGVIKTASAAGYALDDFRILTV